MWLKNLRYFIFMSFAPLVVCRVSSQGLTFIRQLREPFSIGCQNTLVTNAISYNYALYWIGMAQIFGEDTEIQYFCYS